VAAAGGGGGWAGLLLAPHRLRLPLAYPVQRAGAPRYGGTLRGRLIYVDPDYQQPYTCSPPCIYACQDFAVGGITRAGAWWGWQQDL
jgi:hypothetical protein